MDDHELSQALEGPTWEQVHAAITAIAQERGEWAGLPMPVKGMRMVVHPSYPFAEDLGQVFMPEPELHECKDSDVDEDEEIRNEWLSPTYGCRITIYRKGKKFRAIFSHKNSGPMLLTTMGAARAWDIDAELRAWEKLRRLVTSWAFQCYMLTGMFMEKSKRSGLIYIFRRLRPTVAMSSRKYEHTMAIISCLCLHPIGFYDGSWAGAMVPTDDVIAALLLMRGDEADFWRQSNQHEPWDPACGL